MDRIVWTVEKNDVGENVGVMADSDKVPSQQGKAKLKYNDHLQPNHVL